MGMLIQPARFGTPIPDAGENPHRYWRMFIIGGSSNVVSISRFEMRQTAGGTDVAPGNTIISSGTWNLIANLFDNSDSTFGYTNAQAYRNTPYSVGIDFGASSGAWPVIREIVLRNRGDATPGQGATNFAIQYSDDNSAWLTAWMGSFGDWITLGTVRTSTKQANPLSRKVLDIVSPPIDGGPGAIPFAASGNATVSGGRFVFDGTGDFYSNTAIVNAAAAAYRLPYLATIEIDAVLASASGFKGIINIGNNQNRFLVAANGGAFQVWENSTNRISIGSVFGGSNPAKNLKMQLEGTTLRAYIDGALVGTNTFSDVIAYSEIWLGADPADSSARSLLGGFAGVRIWQGLV